jgi:hypothetical protein
MNDYLPSVEYLKYAKDTIEDPESKDIPHVEVEITTDIWEAPEDVVRIENFSFNGLSFYRIDKLKE